jgi:hypothetical protein
MNIVVARIAGAGLLKKAVKKNNKRRFCILLSAKVSVIHHSFKPISTYVSRSATDTFSVMNARFYDIKNIPRPDYFLITS